jgi:PAS domain-containing protein
VTHQQALEVILTRQLAIQLSNPTVIVDREGNVLHLNDAAEEALGLSLDRSTPLTARRLVARYEVFDEKGEPLPPEGQPLIVALEERHPAHARIRVAGLAGGTRLLAVTAVPLVGQGDRFLGAMAFFWEADE